MTYGVCVCNWLGHAVTCTEFECRLYSTKSRQWHLTKSNVAIDGPGICDGDCRADLYGACVGIGAVSGWERYFWAVSHGKAYFTVRRTAFICWESSYWTQAVQVGVLHVLRWASIFGLHIKWVNDRVHYNSWTLTTPGVILCGEQPGFRLLTWSWICWSLNTAASPRPVKAIMPKTVLSSMVVLHFSQRIKEFVQNNFLRQLEVLSANWMMCNLIWEDLTSK